MPDTAPFDVYKFEDGYVMPACGTQRLIIIASIVRLIRFADGTAPPPCVYDGD